MNIHQWFAQLSTRIWPLAFNHLWQATLFFCLAGVVVLLLRRGTSRVRHLVWTIASLKFALPAVLVIGLLGLAGLNLNPRSSQEADAFSADISVFQIAASDLQPATPQTHRELYCIMT